MKTNNIIFYIATGLFSVIILFSAGMYFFNHENIEKAFTHLGYPTYIIYPYASLKLFGLFALWHPKFRIIKEWAYSAFFFAIILAFTAHIMVHDGGQGAALVAMILLIVSYIFNKKINK
ncbi:DoxX family protein [Algibacter pacificus]|uniref:DoxX family protein n=1 Tax=Algibacter pacificus TaxID=2599389 RepID=UPI0011C9F066|nr:DoxX family protein [Algibacter pacificus]